MLVLLYIISAISSVLTYVFEELENFKGRIICFVISILAAIAFCMPTINTIINSFPNVEFWPIFAVSSLILWPFIFISGDIPNAANYIVAAVLLATTLCLLCPAFYPTNNWETCNVEHITTEVVPILTTINSNSPKENVYGDGFIVRFVSDIFSNKFIYQYYKLENGIPVEDEFPKKSTTIHYISNTETPYLEITTTMICSGYNPDFDKHIFIGTQKIYNLYVPEGSILNVQYPDLY